MNRRQEQSHGERALREPESTLRPRRQIGLAGIVLGLSVSLSLTGCVETPPIDNQAAAATPAPIPSETPTPTELPIVPEVIEPTEVVGLNGEYFAAKPTWIEHYSSYPDGAFKDASWNIIIDGAPANSEAQDYTNRIENLRIENDVLVLQGMGNVAEGYTSARIDTKNNEDFLYGKFEISAKIPNGVGSWPAIWLLPTDEKYTNQHPDTDFNCYCVDGEMDILEAIGSQQNVIYGIAHALKSPTNANYLSGYYNTITIPDADTAFHTYGLEWTPTNLTFSVDNQVYYTVSKDPSWDFKRWPYDQRYHVIVNLALGGNWAGQDKQAYPPYGIDDSKLPSSLQLQSVTYYPYVPR